MKSKSAIQFSIGSSRCLLARLQARLNVYTFTRSRVGRFNVEMFHHLLDK